VECRDCPGNRIPVACLEYLLSLDQSTLTAQARTNGGKGPARRLRLTGHIPGVIYGKDSTPLALSLDPLALRTALATPHKFNTVITFKIAGAADRLVLLKDYQHHPVTRKLLHADFQEVRLDKPVKVEIPVVLIGKAAGVVDGGLLSQVGRTVQIICLPGAIPVSIEVDVTPLKINQSLHESDMKLPEGIKLASMIDGTIAVVAAPEAEAAPVVAAAVVAPAAAAGKAAPGAAPAAAAGKAAPAAAKAPAKK
jgi:large subunit ribosomal protein L25